MCLNNSSNITVYRYNTINNNNNIGTAQWPVAIMSRWIGITDCKRSDQMTHDINFYSMKIYLVELKYGSVKPKLSRIYWHRM